MPFSVNLYDEDSSIKPTDPDISLNLINMEDQINQQSLDLIKIYKESHPFYRWKNINEYIMTKKNLNKDFFKDDFLINRILLIIEKFLKVHIKNQIDNGANVIQIFDSWAGLLEEKDLPNYIYTPTLNLVEYVRSLNVPVICFPREIKNYKEFCEIVKPDAISIDYNVDPKKILKDIKIPVQGGLDPKVLLTDYENLKKEIFKYLEIFKDHPYIFNLGHGILPETNPKMVEHLIKIVKNS